MENVYDGLKPVLDVDAGVRQLMDCKKLYCKLLRSFDLASLAEKLIFCYTHRDFAQMAQKANALKSVAEDLGFFELYEVSQMIEYDARKSECKDEEVQMFSAAIERAIESVKRFLWLEEEQQAHYLW